MSQEFFSLCNEDSASFLLIGKERRKWKLKGLTVTINYNTYLMLYAHNIVYRVCQCAPKPEKDVYSLKWMCFSWNNHTVAEEKWQNRDGCYKKCQYVHIRIFWWNLILLIFQSSFISTFKSNYIRNAIYMVYSFI